MKAAANPNNYNQIVLNESAFWMNKGLGLALQFNSFSCTFSLNASAAEATLHSSNPKAAQNSAIWM